MQRSVMRNGKRRRIGRCRGRSQHNTVVMKLWVDKASLVRGSGTVVRCGQGGVLRKCNQTESELTFRYFVRQIELCAVPRPLRMIEKECMDALMKKTRSRRVPRFLYGAVCSALALLQTARYRRVTEKKQRGVILYNAQQQDVRGKGLVLSSN